MILFDEDGNEYEVPNGAARRKPKSTRMEYLKTLIVEVVEEAASVQRIAAAVQPHSTPVNLGTPETPRVETFTCTAQPGVDARILEPINPQAVASTIIARLRAHGFTNEEDLNAPKEPTTEGRARERAQPVV